MILWLFFVNFLFKVRSHRILKQFLSSSRVKKSYSESYMILWLFFVNFLFEVRSHRILGVAEFRDEAESLHNRKINFTGNEREEKNSGVFFIDQWPLAIGHCPYTPLFFIHCVTSTFSN